MKRIERWKPVVGWEGFYEVSDRGRVRSCERTIDYPASKRARPYTAVVAPKMRKQTPAAQGKYLAVTLIRPGVPQQKPYVHTLVLEAFVGPRPDGLVCRHRNGNNHDNRLRNLAWGTYAENNRDTVQHGTHKNSQKTHCKRGHEYTPENTYVHGTARHCRACRRLRKSST